MALLIKKLAAIAVILLASVLLFWFAFYNLIKDVREQRTLIASDMPLIVVSTFHGYLPGLLVIATGVALFSVAMFAFLYRESWYKKAVPFCNIFIGAGLVITFLGAIGANFYWGDSAEQAGYVKCGLTSQVSSAKIHTNYWVKNSEICDESEVSRWLNRQSSGDLTRVNQMLERLGY